MTEEPDGEAKLSLSGSKEQTEIRAAGNYFPDQGIEHHDYYSGVESDSLASVSSHVANALLCGGIKTGNWNFPTNGRHSMTPERYQLQIMDLLNSPWLGSLLPEKFPRTRILAADEGGLGKTLSACLAASKIFRERRGVVVVLCPPALKETWSYHMRLCLRDEQHVVKTRFNSLWTDMEDGIYIISKFATMKRWSDNSAVRDWIPKIELTVIDEAHQGRDGPLSGPLFDSQQAICRESREVIALTASPMQQRGSDLLGVFSMMGGELEKYSSGMGQVFSGNWQGDFERINETLIQGLDLVGGPIAAITDWIADLSPLLAPILGWMPDQDRDEVLDSLRQKGPGVLSNNDCQEGFRLLRDLHPFGRFFSIVRRSDLGPVAGSLFRDRVDEFHRIELGTDHQTLVTIQDPAARRHVESWAGNVNWNYRGVRKGQGDPPGPDEDPRWKFVLDRIRGEIDLVPSSTKRGVVIFTDSKGTMSGMKESLESELCDDAITRIIQSEDQGPDSEGEAYSINEYMHKMASGDALPILICGSAAEMGLDMPWATLGILWDVRKNPEKLLQRTWRLDRRKGHDISDEFRIIHIQNNNNQRFADEMNDSYRQSSVILGRDSGQPFIPRVSPGGELEVPRVWPDRGGVFALSDDETKEIAVRLGIAHEEDLIAHDEQLRNLPLIDALFWKWVRDLTGLPIDMRLLSDGFVSLSDSAFSDGDPRKHVLPETSRLIWDLSNICSESEMGIIWKLMGNAIDVDGSGAKKHRFWMRNGGWEKAVSPGNMHGICTICREGEMSSWLRRLTLRFAFEQGLIQSGPGSSFLGWYCDREWSKGAGSLLVNKRWLELHWENRWLMNTLLVTSPIMAEDQGKVNFLEETPDWENALTNALTFSFHNSDPDYQGHCFYHGTLHPDGRDWPTLSTQTIDGMRLETERLAQSLMGEIMGGGRASREERKNLYTSLKAFTFEASDVIPLIRMEDFQ